jgi:hypothetical protein
MTQIASAGDDDMPFEFSDLAVLCSALLDQDVKQDRNCGELWVLSVAEHLQESDQISNLTDGVDPYDGLGGPPWIEEVSDRDGKDVQRLVVFSFQSLLPETGREIPINDELWASLDGYWEWGHGLDDNPAARSYLSHLVDAVACTVVDFLSAEGEIKICDEQSVRHVLNRLCIEAVDKRANVVARKALASFISELRVI